MSFRAITNAFSSIKAIKLTQSAKLVLLALSNRHNQETGRCDPSVKTISEDLMISVRAVRDALRELEACDLIETVHRKARTGRGQKNRTNRYRLKTGAKSAGGMRQNLPTKKEILGSGLIKLDPQSDRRQFDHRQEVA